MSGEARDGGASETGRGCGGCGWRRGDGIAADTFWCMPWGAACGEREHNDPQGWFETDARVHPRERGCVARTQALQDRHWFGTAVACATAALSVFDQVSDILVCATYFQAGHPLWGSTSLLFVVLGYLVTGFFGSVKSDVGHAWARVLGCLGLGAVVPVVVLVNPRTSEYDRVVATDALNYTKTYEAVLESFPQSVLQSYVLARAFTAAPGALEGVAFTEQQVALQYASLAVSLVSLAVAVLKLRRNIFLDAQTNLGSRMAAASASLSWPEALLGVAARLAAVVLFLLSFRGWAVLYLGASFLLAWAWHARNAALAEGDDALAGWSFDTLPEGAVTALSALMYAMVLQPAPHTRMGDSGRPWVSMVAVRSVETAVMLVLPMVVPVEAGGPLMGQDRPVGGVCDADAGETPAGEGCIAAPLYWAVIAVAVLAHGVLTPVLTHTAVLNRRLRAGDCRASCRCLCGCRSWACRRSGRRCGGSGGAGGGGRGGGGRGGGSDSGASRSADVPVTTVANPFANIRRGSPG